jgi:two-component system, LytTR family, sensor kinase
MKKNFENFVKIAWLCLGIGIWIQFFSYQMSVWESGLFALCFLLALYPLTTYLSKVLLARAMRQKKMIVFIIKALLASVISASAIVALYYVFKYFENIGWFHHSLLFDGKEILLHDFTGAIVSVSLINFGFCGLRFFEENLRLRKTLIDTQLEILQAQITPHFMFNVLNHVNVLIRKEPDLASTLLVRYTNILRYQLYNGKKETIDLQQEINFMKDFIEIEKVRWKNNLTVEFIWKISDYTQMIPPLLFITFIENAFKHVSRSKQEKGFIKIELKQTVNSLIFNIENSKFADIVTPKKEASGIGLENIKARLDILFPNKYSLQIDKLPMRYTAVLTLNL